MNRRISYLTAITAGVGLMILILDSRTALQGAQEGVMLCIRTIIPSLFPFFFLSNILSSSLMGRRIPLLHPIGRLCRIPNGAEYILISGLLGGYPVGAQCISDSLKSGALSRQDARRMLAFCNNCGPAFLFGMASVLFEQKWIPWGLLAIHIAAALIVAIVVPGKPGICTPQMKREVSPVGALNRAVRSIAGVCGWVVLFRVVISFLERWVLWYFGPEIQVIISGILELSNGCIGLGSIDSTMLKFVLCSGFLGFGGLCVGMQTFFAAQNVEKYLYFPGKALQCCVSMTLACMVCGSVYCVIPALLSIILTVILRKTQKSCRIPQRVGV